MPPSPFLAQILDASAAGYAVLATERLLARRPDIADRFMPHPRLAWKENLTGRIRDLSDAVEQGRPQLFIDQVLWGKIAFASRGVPLDDLRESLSALREVLAEELPPDEQERPMMVLDEAFKALERGPTEEPSVLKVETSSGRLAAEYVLAMLEGDRRKASSMVLDAVDSGSITVQDAYLRVLAPAQQELGRMWHMNEITVAEEHFVTATTKMIMAQLLARAKPEPSNGMTVVATSVEGETHDIGLHVAADFLEMAGWKVIFLGGNMPPNDLLQAVVDFKADLVALAATMPSQRRSVARTIRLIRDDANVGRTPILVGGRAFATDDDAWKDVGADGRAVDAGDVVESAARLAAARRGAGKPR
ncbi:MAG: cobalamin B12-binding domain-containing protein [Phycisphaerales bacterium]